MVAPTGTPAHSPGSRSSAPRRLAAILTFLWIAGLISTRPPVHGAIVAATFILMLLSFALRLVPAAQQWAAADVTQRVPIGVW